MYARTIFATTLAFHLGLLSAAHIHAAERPNILFIFTDDQSHRTVSCYPEAYEWVRTPNIDALAKRGVRIFARLRWYMVHAVPRDDADGASSVRRSVDANGRPVSREQV